MSNLKSITTSLIICLCFVSSVIGATINVPAECNTIQTAIDSASNGDIVAIAPGTYIGIGNQIIDFDGKAITLTGTDPNDWSIVNSTIIDANNMVAVLLESEDANSVITGITFINGLGSGVLGAVYCDNVSPTIKRCIFRNNEIGLFSRYGSPLITQNKFYNNSEGGLKLLNSPANVTSNEFHSNYEYGINVQGSVAGVNITNNTLTGNPGYGIKRGGPRIVSMTVSDCILWDNGDDLYDGFSAIYSCVEDPNDSVGTGNISVDPIFVDPANANYRLSRTSPCIDIGDPNGTYTGQKDLDGYNRVIDIARVGDSIVDVDMGAYEFYPIPADGNVIYVDHATTGNNDGTSWIDAYNDISDAISVSANGNEIWVAEGTYVLSSTLTIDDEIDLYGGFVGNETERDQRDRENNQVIVDGNDLLRGFYINQVDAVIDGLTVQNCQVTNAHGAGMLINRCSPTVENCVFKNNTAGGSSGRGGGMSIQYASSDPTIKNCVFYSNDASLRGGGINTFGVNSGWDFPSGLTLINCVFVENTCIGPFNDTVIGGGGFANSNTDTTMINCTFYNNTSDRGGAVFCETKVCEIDIDMYNCIFWGNNLYGNTKEGYEFHVKQSDDAHYGDLNFYDCDLDRHIFSYSDHWYRNYSYPSGEFYDITDTINSNPNFFSPTDPDGADNIFMTSDDGLAITTGSCCKDSGTDDYVDGTIFTVDTDITGANRIDDPNNGVDIGAYEI